MQRTFIHACNAYKPSVSVSSSQQRSCASCAPQQYMLRTGIRAKRHSSEAGLESKEQRLQAAADTSPEAQRQSCWTESAVRAATL